MPKAFLTAEWRNLCLVSYAVPPSLLEPRLPKGWVLDTQGDTAFLSLVAFDFLKTRVWGVSWPGYRDFPEINARFYVRDRSGRRAVVFIKELVPQRWVAYLARKLYNEPYEAAEMRSSATTNGGVLEVRHDWSYRGSSHHLQVRAKEVPHLPDEESQEHFFKEHDLGVGTDRKGRVLTYSVEHPHWLVHEVLDTSWQIDWQQLYGEEFAFLTEAEPVSIVLAEGSAISVGKAETST